MKRQSVLQIQVAMSPAQSARATGETYSWATFEDYLEAEECKCGKQHPYINPDFTLQNKWSK